MCDSSRPLNGADAIPYENGEPVKCGVAWRAGHPESSWRLVWLFDGGKRREPFGTPYRKAREACLVAKRINEGSGAEVAA